jgi:hypothetical protein
MVHLSFAGHAVVPLPDGALYWPAREALLVADLHLEKSSWYAARGQLLPPYDSRATLDRLAAAIDLVQPREVWCLGDSFHDAGGPARLGDDVRSRLEAFAVQRRWVWITGNHDAAADLPGELLADARLDGVVLRHEACAAESAPEISGHFHPKLRLQLRGRAVSRRCFVASERKLILPAFGALAGGLDASDPAILSAAGQPALAYVATAGRLLRFPLAA